MIRNLKVLLLSAMALAAFGALSVSGAHAAEEFHCSVAPCTWTMGPDGAPGSVTASPLVIAKNAKGETGTYKCAGLTGHATSEAKTTDDLRFTNLAFTSPCKVIGSEVKIRMNECNFTFTSKGGGAAPGATIHVECPTAKHIETEIPESGCVVEITPQTLTGALYHNIGTPGTPTTEITVEIKAPNPPGLIEEVTKVGAGCVPAAAVGDQLTAEFKANVLITGEKDNLNKEMVEAWWA